MKHLPAILPDEDRRGAMPPWVLAVLIGLVAFIVYALFAANFSMLQWGDHSLFHVSKSAYFNYLADAFLHGQLHLRVTPESTHDLVHFNDRVYLYWPPFPALLLLPFIAVFGVGFSDIFLTIVAASINVSLTFLLLRKLRDRHLIELPNFHLGMLVVAFAFGTVHLFLAPLGRVWFTAQILGYLCIAIAYLAAVTLDDRWAFVTAGLGMAAAVMTRNHLILLGLWPAWYLIHTYRSRGRRWMTASIACGLTPIAVALTLLALYNFARFGSVTEMGLDLHQMAGAFAPEYKLYGAFHVHYLPLNLYYQYLFYPFPLSAESAMGGSLFLLTPLFFGVLFAFRSKVDLSKIVLVISILLTATPILLLMGTGWVQFGPRYTLDFTVPLLILTALGIGRWPRWVVALLVLVSIGHYVLGTLFLSGILS
jgi:hypothetical protein